MELDDKFRRSLKAEGIEQKTRDVIKSMLENKLDYKIISKVSNKSIKTIKEIEKSMSD